MRTPILIALAAAAVLAGAGVAQPPGGGPYTHRIESATSTDGLTWRRDGRVLLEHASVPAAVVTPAGAIRVYYVDASRLPETTNCAESRDGGGSFRVLGCRIRGLPSPKALDPSIVRLADGRYRLYYYASDVNPGAAGTHTIRRAISRDGVRFADEGIAFAYGDLVDPDVFWTGKEWLMYVFSRGDTIVARSKDGRKFTYAGSLGLRGWGTTAPVRLPDGRFRLYAFNQQGQQEVASFLSADGRTWTREDGVRLQAGSGEQITDPFVVRLRDGTWKMIFKVDPSPPQQPGPPPSG